MNKNVFMIEVLKSNYSLQNENNLLLICYHFVQLWYFVKVNRNENIKHKMNTGMILHYQMSMSKCQHIINYQHFCSQVKPIDSPLFALFRIAY